MNPGFVFFSPAGRIDRKTFLFGAIALFAASVGSDFLSASLGPSMVLLSIIIAALIWWCALAVYGKRLHDAGLSAWLLVAFAILYWVVYFIGTSVFLPIIDPEFHAFQIELQEQVQAGTMSFMEMMQRASEVEGSPILTSVASNGVATLIVGGIHFLLGSNTGANKHGPATSADTASSEL